MRDWRRVNVAVTRYDLVLDCAFDMSDYVFNFYLNLRIRAQKKLIILGSLRVMEKIPILKQLSDTVLEHGWVVPVPSNGLSMYSADALSATAEVGSRKC